MGPDVQSKSEGTVLNPNVIFWSSFLVLILALVVTVQTFFGILAAVSYPGTNLGLDPVLAGAFGDLGVRGGILVIAFIAFIASFYIYRWRLRKVLPLCDDNRIVMEASIVRGILIMALLLVVLHSLVGWPQSQIPFTGRFLADGILLSIGVPLLRFSFGYAGGLFEFRRRTRSGHLLAVVHDSEGLPASEALTPAEDPFMTLLSPPGKYVSFVTDVALRIRETKRHDNT
ncbi:hypothetical protein EU538_02280 [Candidatus Thorarchaeota archaeon]|nr:MAG: hypothetical protein EU538_02280 [Candidatus Thorarchaeota archaeon]